MTKRIFYSVLIVCVFFVALITSSQGGVISKQGETVSINRLHITYQVVDDTTIRQMSTLEYVGNNQEFIWLIPVPSNNILSVKYLEEFEDKIVLPRGGIDFIGQEENPCERLFGYPDGDFGVIDYLSSAHTKFYSHDIYQADQIIEWLDSSAYLASDETLKTLTTLINQNYSFLVSKFSVSDNSNQHITEQFEIVYQGANNDLHLPIFLEAASDGNPRISPEVSIEVNIIADVPYTVMNFPVLELNIERIYPVHVLSLPAWRRRVPAMFITEVMKTLNESNEISFVQLFGGHIDDRTFGSIYLTEFFTQFDQEQIDKFPIFLPAPDQPDFTNIKLPDIDPLHFWRCSSRTLTVNEETYSWLGEEKVTSLFDYVKDYVSIEVELPEDNTYLREIGINVRHPEGWILSEFEHESIARLKQSLADDYVEEIPHSQRFYVLSPELVTYGTIAAYLDGDDTPPMFVISDVLFTMFRGFIGPITTDYKAMDDRYLELPNLGTDGRGVSLYILTDDDDWQANEEMYEAMLDFPFTYQYYAHENLRHTLFYHYHIGYPEGWIEYLGDDSDIYFLPKGNHDLSNAIWLKVSNPPLRKYQLQQDLESNDTINQFIEEYGLRSHDADILRNSIVVEGCHIVTPPLKFNNENSHGYILFIPYTFVQLSINNDVDIDESTLKDMIDSYFEPDPDACG